MCKQNLSNKNKRDTLVISSKIVEEQILHFHLCNTHFQHSHFYYIETVLHSMNYI